MFKFLRKLSAPAQAQPQAPPVQENLADLMRVFLVEEVKARMELRRAESESRLSELEKREALRAARAEAARLRNRTLPRDKRGKLMKAQPQACGFCRDPYYYPFTFEELQAHKAHTAQASNGGPP